MSQSILRIGTRGSRLARAQAGAVASALLARGTHSEIVAIKTTGDRIKDKPLAEAGGKGLFTKELEEALLAGRIDIAVHSMKDLPTSLSEGLTLAAILPREDPADVLVSSVPLAQLKPGARVGTSSVRRKAQLLRARPDADCVMLRGNVDTRLAKFDSGAMDAILLAFAGLKRLGLAARANHILSTDEWLPSLGQGAVGVETRASDTQTGNAVRPLDHAPSAAALACERAFQAALDGSCRTPIAGLAVVGDGVLSFRGEVLAPDGSDCVQTSFRITLGDRPREEAARAGREAGTSLRPRARAWLIT